MPDNPTIPNQHSTETNDRKSKQPRKGRRKRRIKRILAGIAPQLAHALGGPLAGNAVERISEAILGKTEADEAAIDAAINHLTPEQIHALKRADLEFHRMLENTTIETAKIAAADRANARSHQQIMQDWTPSAIGALIILGFFIVLGAMVARRLPEGAETEFSIMLGALATMTAAVVNYFFGSSAGSKEKTKLMSLMKEQNPDQEQQD